MANELDNKLVLSKQLTDWWNNEGKSKWRTRKKLSQYLKIGDSTLGDYFNGRAFPKNDTAKKLFEVTNCAILKAETLPLLESTATNNKPTSAAIVAPVNPSIPTSPVASSQGTLIGTTEPDIKAYKTFRIGVTGDVLISKLECKIIDTRVFQRLRSIKQLGTSYLVYPSALHTRFEHSIGTLQEAEKIIQCVRDNPKSAPHQTIIDEWDHQLIRLAALLHDICHIPFGHTLEDETNVITSKHDNDTARRDKFITNSEIGTILKTEIGEDRFNLLMKIISTKHHDVGKLGPKAYMADIVNNTLCADLLDYLRRDLYFCFLREDFGDRFMKYLYLDEVPNSEEIIKENAPKTARRLIIRLWKKESFKYRRDVLSELCELLRTRYTLGEKVYYHHAKISSSAMISRAVWSAMNENPKQPLTIQQISDMGDEQLLHYLANCNQPVAKKLANSILNRSLYKSAFTLNRIEAEAPSGTNWIAKMVEQFHIDAKNRVQVEDQLANLCNLEPGDVLIYCPSQDMGKKYARMLVEWKDEYKMLKDIEDPATKPALGSVEKSHELLWSLSVYVKPSAKIDEKCMKSLLGFCDYRFSPHKNPQDAERKLESALTSIIIEKMGTGGTPTDVAEIASKLVAVQRRGTTMINQGVIDSIIKETKNTK